MNKNLIYNVKSFFHNHNKYIKENIDYISEMNYSILKIGSSLFLILIVFYSALAHFVFPQYKLERIYIIITLVQVIVEIFVLTGVIKRCSNGVKHIICAAFQLYAVGFVGFMSVFPVEIESPGIYLSPVVLAFSVIFIFKWNWTIFLATIELSAFSILSITNKSPSYYYTDVSVSFLTFVVVIICTYVICKLRISDNQSKNKLKEMSAIDKLTGLNNKASTEFLCKSFINDENNAGCILMVIDFDNFKIVNDTLGHKQGDEVLKKFGLILRHAVRDTDIAGRIGGDEFLIMLKNCSDENVARMKAEQVLKNTRQILSDVLTHRFSCSIGVAIMSENKMTYDKLFAKADLALYNSKRNGKDIMSFFEDEEAALNSGEKPLVLIVDDLEVSRAVLRSCFEETYSILEAYNGDEALSYMRQYGNKLSVVLLDLEMPVMDGYKVLEIKSKDSEIKDIPVVVITINERSEIKVFDLGAQDVIQKPFDPEIVQKRVGKVIRNNV